MTPRRKRFTHGRSISGSQEGTDGRPLPRVLVGILWSGEPQLAECVGSLSTQQDASFDYFIISHMTKRDAHNALYGLFMEHGTGFDALVKLDADIVLGSPEFLARACRRLRDFPGIDLLLVPMHDYFTDQPMVGLHIYRSTVRWSPREDHLFTDSNDVPADRQVVDALGFERPGMHCPDPSPTQAFHFGVHRGVKLRAALSASNTQYIRRHVRTLRFIKRRARTSPTMPHVYASLGFAYGLDARFGEEHISYANREIAQFVEGDLSRLAVAKAAKEARRAHRKRRVTNPKLSWYESLMTLRSAGGAIRKRLRSSLGHTDVESATARFAQKG